MHTAYISKQSQRLKTCNEFNVILATYIGMYKTRMTPTVTNSLSKVQQFIRDQDVYISVPGT